MGKNKAFRNQPHDDLSVFGNRLWVLMERNGYDTPKTLAADLYKMGLVKVKSHTEDYNEKWVVERNAIASIEKKIAAHLNAVEVDDAQGELIKAYCVRFKCSADYLFGFTPIESGDIEVRRICERTGLSEKAVLHLIQGIDGQADISHINLIWSRLLEDDLFFTLPSDWQAAYREACECIKSRAAGAAIVEALEEGELPSIEETLLFEKTKIASKKGAEHYAAYYGMLYKLSQDIANALDSLVEGQTKQENILERAHKNILMQYRRIIAKLKGEPLPPEPNDKEFEWNVHIL